MWHQPCQRCKYTTLVDIQKRTIKSYIVTHVESHASTVSLLESREQCYINAINNNNSDKVMPQAIRRKVLSLSLVDNGSAWECHSGGNLGV